MRSQMYWAGAAAFLALALPSASARSQSDAVLSETFNALVDSEYKSTEPGGVILVARNGQVIFERAFGMANLELGVPMKTNMVFAIASITKQFTAALVLQQVEKSTLSLTDTVGKFLPGYPAALKGITIEQLLTHTSGIANPKSIASLLALGKGWLTAEQIMAAFKDQPLEFQPGTRMVYSNAGYQLLGYIIEKVTGEAFPDLIHKTLLKPIGMEQSFWGDDTRVALNRASPYLYTRYGIQNAVHSNVQIAFAAGAIQSTARDFLKWHRAVLSGAVISKAMLQRAWTPARLADGTITDYGYGWFLGELQGSPIVEHGGNMGGFMSHAMYMPREDVLVAVFLNARGNRLPELVATDLAAMSIGRPLNLRPIVLSDDLLRSYAGAYRNKDREEIVLSLENGKLFYQRGANAKLGLTPYAKDQFVFDNTSIVGRANRDAQGRVVSLDLQSLRRTAKNVLVRADSAGR